ncbi:MAG: dephospho-CoA kinase, partial [Clostridiaceae bacterium]|nr:dephospho-CoA kinase [Clostridiaceae bacterium]
MRIIGITGGIGSGKSTVSRILSGLGAKVIDADRIARDVVKKGEKALYEITAAFGSGVLDDNGELDRHSLSKIVFSDPDRLNKLNEITHRFISERIIQLIEQYSNNDTIVIDAPIPVKEGFLNVADEVWVVHASEDVRINRVMKRSSMSDEEVKKRIRLQMSDQEYMKIADLV